MKKQTKKAEKVDESIKCYYTAPPDECFNDLRTQSVKLWQTLDRGKARYVKTIENSKGNFMYILALFDPSNQAIIFFKIKESTIAEIIKRLPIGHYLR